MTEKDEAKTDIEAAFPNIAEWVEGCGWIEIGDQDWQGFVVRALNEGGLMLREGGMHDSCRGDDGVGEGLGEVARRERLIVPPKKKPRRHFKGFVNCSEWRVVLNGIASVSVPEIASSKSLNFFKPPTSLIRARSSLRRADPPRALVVSATALTCSSVTVAAALPFSAITGLAGTAATAFAFTAFLSVRALLIWVLILATWPALILMPCLVKAAAISPLMAFGWQRHRTACRMAFVRAVCETDQGLTHKSPVLARAMEKWRGAKAIGKPEERP